MKQTTIIKDLRAVLSFILTDPKKAHEILTRIIDELTKEKVNPER